MWRLSAVAGRLWEELLWLFCSRTVPRWEGEKRCGFALSRCEPKPGLLRLWWWEHLPNSHFHALVFGIFVQWPSSSDPAAARSAGCFGQTLSALWIATAQQWQHWRHHPVEHIASEPAMFPDAVPRPRAGDIQPSATVSSRGAVFLWAANLDLQILGSRSRLPRTGVWNPEWEWQIWELSDNVRSTMRVAEDECNWDFDSKLPIAAHQRSAGFWSRCLRLSGQFMFVAFLCIFSKRWTYRPIVIEFFNIFYGSVVHCVTRSVFGGLDWFGLPLNRFPNLLAGRLVSGWKSLCICRPSFVSLAVLHSVFLAGPVRIADIVRR